MMLPMDATTTYIILCPRRYIESRDRSITSHLLEHRKIYVTESFMPLMEKSIFLTKIRRVYDDQICRAVMYVRSKT